MRRKWNTSFRVRLSAAKMGLTTSDTGSLKELRNDSHATTFFFFFAYLVRRVELKREKDGVTSMF